MGVQRTEEDKASRKVLVAIRSELEKLGVKCAWVHYTTLRVDGDNACKLMAYPYGYAGHIRLWIWEASVETTATPNEWQTLAPWVARWVASGERECSEEAPVESSCHRLGSHYGWSKTANDEFLAEEKSESGIARNRRLMK